MQNGHAGSTGIEVFHAFFKEREATLKVLSALAPFILRLVVGIIFIFHGLSHFTQMEGTMQFFARLQIPYSGYAAPALALLEVVGGACLILGVGTRIFAFLLAITMGVAIYKVKLNQGLLGGYELELVLFAVLLSLVCSGSGTISLLRQRAQPKPIKQPLPQ